MESPGPSLRALGDQPNLPALFREQAAARGTQPFLWRRVRGVWTSRSYAEVEREASEASAGWRAMGLEPGDRVVILSENRPEWLIADLSILDSGCVTVPAYTTHTVEDLRHLLDDSGAKAAVVSTAPLLRRLLAAASSELRWVVAFDPPRQVASPGPALQSWEALREAGRRSAEHREAGKLERTDPAFLHYTSGTSGLPRGVILTHGAILCDLEGARRILLDLDLGEEVFLSFLPISHAYEHTAGQHLAIAIGAQIYYVENAAHVVGALPEVRPTLLMAVPRFCETLYERLLRERERQGAVRRAFFDGALRLGTRRLQSADVRSALERAANGFFDSVVRKRIRARFGGRLKAIVSGGAPLNPDLVLFFNALGLPLLQGYGLTEAAPVVSCNPPKRIKAETVGPPLPGVEVRITEDGEILVRGELVMKGYWNDPETTARTIRDGWLHTGDVGRVDEDGYLIITDRMRDFIKTSGGDMVPPQRIEGLLMLEPEIAQAVVFGDRRPHLVALLVPELTAMEAWARRRNLPTDLASCSQSEEYRRHLAGAVDRANRRMSPPERIRRFALLSAPFSVENELLTPTLKLRRHKIAERYRELIEQLYEGERNLV